MELNKKLLGLLFVAILLVGQVSFSVAEDDGDVEEEDPLMEEPQPEVKEPEVKKERVSEKHLFPKFCFSDHPSYPQKLSSK
jgi:hypothetical protein